MNDRRGPLWFDAFAVAMLAKSGGLTADRVDGMRVKAEELLSRDDPLFRSIMDFCTQYELPLTPPALTAEGDRLHVALELALVPVPPGLDRADIHG